MQVDCGYLLYQYYHFNTRKQDILKVKGSAMIYILVVFRSSEGVMAVLIILQMIILEKLRPLDSIVKIILYFLAFCDF